MMVAAASDTMLHTRLLSTNDREKLRGWILIHYYCILFTYIRYTIHVFNILPFFSASSTFHSHLHFSRYPHTISIVPSIQHQLHHPPREPHGRYIHITTSSCFFFFFFFMRMVSGRFCHSYLRFSVYYFPLCKIFLSLFLSIKLA